MVLGMSRKVYIANAFSLNMLEKFPAEIYAKEVSMREVLEAVKDGAISAIGHKETADFLTNVLGIEITTNRIQIKLGKEDKVFVIVIGERLPEGKILTSEELMEFKSKIKFILVEVNYPD